MEKQKYRKTWIFSALTIVVSLGLILLSRLSRPFADWYAETVFPALPNTFGRFFSPLPFSVYEMMLWALLLAVPVLLILLVVSLICKSQRQKLKRRLGTFLRTVVSLLSAALLLFTLGSGINYSRRPFSQMAGFTLKASSVEELIALEQILVRDAQEALDEIDLDENGYFTIDGVDLHGEARSAMQKLGERYPQLDGYYPNPKAVVASEVLSHFNLLGVYAPLTIEANYNQNAPDYQLPFTVCHELSHLRGFMREDEAGFIAYLACLHSDSAAFRYSGTINALTYVLNALYPVVDDETYAVLYLTMPEQIRRDYEWHRIYWKQYEGKAAEVSDAVNDIYLKANAQTDGVRSYGRMVDLLLAYYRTEAPV